MTRIRDRGKRKGPKRGGTPRISSCPFMDRMASDLINALGKQYWDNAFFGEPRPLEPKPNE